MHKQHGFTLLELMVVVAIMAIATAGVVLALRDGTSSALEREAHRVVAVLESGRMHSRATGQEVIWLASEQGYLLVDARGAPLATAHATATATAQGTPANITAWLAPGTVVRRLNASAAERLAVVLGPEPILPAQSITLVNAAHSITVRTDGLHPFAVTP